MAEIAPFVLEYADPPGLSSYGLKGPPPGSNQPWRGFIESRGSGKAWFYTVLSESTGKWNQEYGVCTDGTPLDTLTRVVSLRSWNGATVGTGKVDWQPGDGNLKVFPTPAGDLLELLVKDYEATTPPPWAEDGTRWVDITGAPTSCVWKRYDGAQWTPIGTFNETAGTFTGAHQFAATQRLLGRNTAGAGAAEEVTATQLLDWIGATRGNVPYRGASAWAALPPSTDNDLFCANGVGTDPSYKPLTTVMAVILGNTRGQIAYRGASVWTALAPGTAGQYLKTGGAGADPSWDTIVQNLRLGGIVDTGTPAASLQVSGMAAAGARHLIFWGGINPATDGQTLAIKLLNSGGTMLTSVTTAAGGNSGVGVGFRFVGFAPYILDNTNTALFVLYQSSGGNGLLVARGDGTSGIVDQVQVVASSGNVAGNLQVYYTT
jgi:hypothetical protein